ncbi:MFS transporter [Arthrobacter sp. H41]|uniref:MFS transporter n=1 Tax=Arthrobacter sp. H41 TaxID=1312978 RepID=UPI0004B86403|nr:MFS transporter [Arthrobacter sp. H41]
MNKTSGPTQSAGAMSAELRPLTIGILAIITCAAFEAMAVVTAMPSVASELSGEASYGLAFSMYLTASLLGTVLAGSWCDRQGPRPALAVGMFLMILGLLAAGAAPAFWLVTVGRAISGLGGGFMIVALYVVIARAFPQHAQPVVFGWLSAAWVVPALVGPLVAGVVAENLGWRWVFLGVAPIVLAAVLIVWPKTAALGPADGAERPADNAGTGAQEAGGSGADTAGPTAGGSGRQRALRGIGLAGGVFAAQWALSRLAADGSGSAFSVTAYLLLAGAGLVAVFVTLPGLLPHGTLKLAKGLPSIIATRGFVNVAFFGAEAFIPLMLVSARGFDAATAGLALSAGALGWTGGSFLQARVRFRREWLLVAGSTVLSLSLGGFALASSVEAPLWLLVMVWAFSGFAMGMTLSSTSVLVLKLSSSREQGRNSASLQISDQLGGVVGTAGAGALFALLRDPAEPAQVSVFVAIWLALCVFAAAGIVSGLRGAQANDAGPSQDPRKAMEGTVPA